MRGISSNYVIVQFYAFRGSGYTTDARVIGEKNVVRGSTHATTLPTKKIATIATTMPMITRVGLDFSSAIILRMLIDERKVREN